MTTKRFTILYGLDENPFDWDILDNEKDAIICQYNGTPICELLNELHEENQRLKKENKSLIDGIKNCAKQGADFSTKIWQSKNTPATITGRYYD